MTRTNIGFLSPRKHISDILMILVPHVAYVAGQVLVQSYFVLLTSNTPNSTRKFHQKISWPLLAKVKTNFFDVIFSLNLWWMSDLSSEGSWVNSLTGPLPRVFKQVGRCWGALHLDTAPFWIHVQGVLRNTCGNNILEIFFVSESLRLNFNRQIPEMSGFYGLWKSK